MKTNAVFLLLLLIESCIIIDIPQGRDLFIRRRIKYVNEYRKSWLEKVASDTVLYRDQATFYKKANEIQIKFVNVSPKSVLINCADTFDFIELKFGETTNNISKKYIIKQHSLSSTDYFKIRVINVPDSFFTTKDYIKFGFEYTFYHEEAKYNMFNTLVCSPVWFRDVNRNFYYRYKRPKFTKIFSYLWQGQSRDSIAIF